MFSDFYHTFYYVSLILSVFISAFLIKKVNVTFWLLAILILLTFVSESVAKYLAYVQRTNNNAVYHFFTLLEYFFYAQVYKRLLEGQKWNRLINISFIFLVVAELVNGRYFQPLNTDNTNTMILECLLLTFLSLSWFNKAKESRYTGSLVKEGIFWFNCAVLFYYSFSVLIWGFHSLKVYRLEKPPAFMYDVLLLTSGLLYLIYSLALILNYSARKSLS